MENHMGCRLQNQILAKRGLDDLKVTRVGNSYVMKNVPVNELPDVEDFIEKAFDGWVSHNVTSSGKPHCRDIYYN